MSGLPLARPVSLAAIRDGRLSFGARGLYLYLSNLPVGMTPSMASCESPEGSTWLATLLKELRSVGAIRYEPIRGLDGRLGGTIMILVPAEEWACLVPSMGNAGTAPEGLRDENYDDDNLNDDDDEERHSCRP